MSEILNRIDFAGRACFQFYDAFFRPYHFDTDGPETNFFSYENTVPIRSVIIRVINKIGRLLGGSLIY